MRRVPVERAVFYQALRGDLAAFAERRFGLSAKQADGYTAEEHLEQALRLAKTPARRRELAAELTRYDLPPAGDYLWRAFTRLNNRRTSHGFGANPITWTDMAAFATLSGLRLAPWEVEIIELLDMLWMTEQSKALGTPPQADADGEPDGRQPGRNPTHRGRSER